MSETIRINFFKDGGSELFSLLAYNNIPIRLRRSDPGVIVAAGEFLDFVTVLGGASLTPSFEAVLIQWLKNIASRKVIVLTKDKAIIHIEGMSPSGVKKVRASAQSVTAIQTKPYETALNKNSPLGRPARPSQLYAQGSSNGKI